jgi:hypothetical protein
MTLRITVFSIIMLSVAIFYRYADCHRAECRYAECHCVECHYAECRFAEFRCAECCYAECHHAECRCAECRGASLPTFVFHNSWAELVFTKTTLKLITSGGLLGGPY